MTKPYNGDWVLRTVLFVPGHVEAMIAHGARSDADCVVLDLEDAVPTTRKARARECVRRALEGGDYAQKTVFVRVNPIGTGWTLRDLDGVACRQLHGFVYPMAQTADDIRSFDAQLSLIESHLELERGHFSLIVLIETTEGVLNAHAIAQASSRVVGLLFGCEDFLAELGGRHNEQDTALHTPRALVAMAARAAGVEPIDTPYVRVHDLEGLERFATRARDLGMAGMLVMSPKQVAVARAAYTPSPEEVEHARAVVAAKAEADDQDRGIVVVNGNFVSPPTIKAAHRVLRRYEAICALEAFSARSES